MDAVYPGTMSALARGRRRRRSEPRARHRTMPVTFAEIKEVDEESCEAAAREAEARGAEARGAEARGAEARGAEARRAEARGAEARGAEAGARRRLDVLEERLGLQFAEFRRRRALPRDALRERESPPPAPPAPARAGSEPGT